MEKEQRIITKGLKIMAGIALISGSSFLGGEVHFPKETDPSLVDPGPPRELSPGIDLVIISSPPPSPSPEQTTASEPSPTQDYEMERVLSIMSSKQNLFSKSMIEDVTVYYPVYKAVADKYGLKWYLLWIVHEQESSASRNPKAFDGSSAPHLGAMQINDKNYPNLDLKNAAEGLEDLEKFQTIHPERDLQDIAEGGLILHADIEKYKNHKYTENQAVEITLEKYTNPKTGQYRFFGFYKVYERVFG
jgi:hypothetical protein